MGVTPDFNPIEKLFSKLKALLRKAAERTVDGLWRVIGDCLDRFTPRECAMGGRSFGSACHWQPVAST